MEMPKSPEAVTETTQDNVVYENSNKDEYGDIIEHMKLCCLCGGELDYHYDTDYIMLTVREEAHCPSCGIRTKKESHSIQ